MPIQFDKAFAEKIEAEVPEIKDEVIAIRRHIHMHPEIGFDTHETEEFIKKHLQEAGIDLTPAKMGVIGRIPGKNHDRIVALRADMDALCLQEETGAPYASKYPNKMHACGHDGHTAMLLGAAKLLSRHREELPTDVLLIFQPAEEGPNLGGARIMLADMQEKGIAQQIEAMFAIHLFNDFPIGTVGYRYGSMFASTDEFDIKIIGYGGHAGQPNKTVDALSVGAKVVTAMESFMSRRIDPLANAVFSVGIFQSGTAKNIVAETAKIAGTIRCQQNDVREFILESLEQVVKGTCQAYGADCHIDILHGLPVLINDDAVTEYARSVLVETVGEEHTFCAEKPIMGAEDFAYFAQALPSCFLWLASGNPEKGATYLGHHPKFDFDEDAMETGIKIFCNLARNR